MPAILRTGDWLGSGAQSSLTFSANEAKFRERSQRVKIQQKQYCKMNGAPIGVNLRRSTIPARTPLGKTGQRGPVDRDCDHSSAQRLTDRLS